LNPLIPRNLVICLEARSPQFVRSLSKQEQFFMQQMWQARHPGTQLIFTDVGFPGKEDTFTGWIRPEKLF